MKDVIYRQAAIDVLKRDEALVRAFGYQHAVDAIHSLPSAQPDLDEWCTDCKEYDQERHNCPRWNRVIRQTLKDVELERKKGRWKVSNLPKGKLIYCSECEFGKKIADKRKYNFCPNCGAKMMECENG